MSSFIIAEIAHKTNQVKTQFCQLVKREKVERVVYLLRFLLIAEAEAARGILSAASPLTLMTCVLEPQKLQGHENGLQPLPKALH